MNPSINPSDAYLDSFQKNYIPPSLKLPTNASSDLPLTVELARRRLLKKAEIDAKNNLGNHSIVPLNGSKMLSLSSEKSLSVGMRLFSWITNTQIALWTAKNVLKSTRFCMTVGSSSHRIKNKLDQDVDVLSGSLHLSKAIHSCTPSIAEWLKQRLISLGWHESINNFLNEEHYTLQMFFDVLLPTAYINIAKSIRDSSLELSGPQKNVSLVDIFGCLCEIANAHLPHINARIDAIEKTPDPIKRERKLCQLFAPLVEDFLVIAFPDGVKEFPIIKVPFASKYLWTSFQKRFLPMIFLEVYRQFASPINKTKETKIALLKLKGGESLVSLSELAGHETGEMLPSLFLNKSIEDPTHSRIVKIIVESFVNCINGSDALKQWLGSWLGNQLEGLGSSSNIDIKKLWMFLGGYIEPLLLHVFYHLSEVPPVEGEMKKHIPDALGMITIKLFSICSHFFNEYDKTINERLKILAGSLQDPRDDEVLLTIFTNLADDLFMAMGLAKSEDWPLPAFIRDAAAHQLKSIMPRFLLKQYFSITNKEINNVNTRKKLSALLFDLKNFNGEILKEVLSPYISKEDLYETNLLESMYKKSFEEFSEKVWKESGTEHVIKAIEKICSVFSTDLVDSLMTMYGVSFQKILNPESNAFMNQAYSYMQSIVEAMLLEIALEIVKTTKEKISIKEGEHPKQLLIFHTIMRFSDIIDRGLKNIQMLQDSDNATSNFQGHFKDIRKAFAGFAYDLHTLGGKNLLLSLPLEGLPLSEAIREVFSNAIKEVLLPDILFDTYCETTKWEDDLEKSLSELEQCYHTTYSKWGCLVLAQYVSDYIKNYLTNSSAEVADLWLASFKEYLMQSKNGNGHEVANFLQKQRGNLEALLSQNIRLIGESEDPKLANIWPSITKYIEAIIAKFFAEFSKTIEQIERENPDFMIDIAITMLKDTAEYFEVVNRVTEEIGEEHGYKVNPSTMIASFGKKLHDGIPLDPKAPQYEKDKTRLEGYFIPLAKKLLDLANLSINDFPIPSPIRQQIGELLLGKILPLAILSADQKILEHHVRDTLMLNFVQTLYTALNAIELITPKEEMPEEPTVQLDPKQKKLNETCGALVLALVKLIPDTTAQYVFMKEKVKNMSAEVIGETMMPYLSSWTLLQLIDRIMFNGLLSFHPAKWEGKAGREALIPRKAFLRPDGKMELKPVKKFKFVFPKTAAEIDAENALKIQEAKKTRIQLRNGFTRTISSQLNAKMWSFIKSLWGSLQSHLIDFIEGQFPERGPKIKEFADKIARRVFFDVIGTMLHFIFSPLLKFIHFAVEKIHIDRRSDDIIENLHSDALENLIYKWLDTILDSLMRLKKKPKLSKN